MLRFFVALNLLFLNLYACKGGYDSCIDKVKDSKTIQYQSLSIPVKNFQRIVYSKQRPKGKILKYDPFLSLYLIKDTMKFPYPFDINMRLQLGTAMITDSAHYDGKFTKNQVGLNHLARYSVALKFPSIITSPCCNLEAIVTKRGIIQKSYINRFLNSKNVLYADIGVRVKDHAKSVVVTQSDPLMPANPFKKGDYIVEYDGKKVTSAAQLMKSVLFSPIGSQHRVKVKRAKRFLTLNVKSYKRYGGGDISDTFLEQKGVYFTQSLKIIKLEKEFATYGLKIGDKLLEVNGVRVKNQKELRDYLQKYKNYSKLLIERNHFQFFVNIK